MTLDVHAPRGRRRRCLVLGAQRGQRREGGPRADARADRRDRRPAAVDAGAATASSWPRRRGRRPTRSRPGGPVVWPDVEAHAPGARSARTRSSPGRSWSARTPGWPSRCWPAHRGHGSHVVRRPPRRSTCRRARGSRCAAVRRRRSGSPGCRRAPFTDRLVAEVRPPGRRAGAATAAPRLRRPTADQDARARDRGDPDPATSGSSTTPSSTLSPGLNVVTGETGAGKTMVVSGLGLLLGGRADSGLVRAGADRAVVEGVVDVAGRPPGARPRRRGRRRRRGRPGAGAHGLGRRALAGPRRRPGRTGRACSPSSARCSSPCTARPTSGGCGAPTSTARCSTGSAGRDVADALSHATARLLRRAHHRARPSWPACARRPRERAREADALRRRPGADRGRSTRSPARTPPCGVEDERLGHADELRAGGRRRPTPPSPATTTPGCRRRACSRRSPPRRPPGVGQRQRPRPGRDRHAASTSWATSPPTWPPTSASYLADADVDPARLEQVEQRRAALGELTRLVRRHRRRRAAPGAARPPGGSAELDGAGDRIGELEARVVDLTAAREEAAGRLTAARSAAAAALGARITDELSHLAMGSADASSRRPVEDAGRFTADGRDDIEIRLAVRVGHRAAGGDQGGIRR